MKTCAFIAGSTGSEPLSESFLKKQLALLYTDFGVEKILSGVHRGDELYCLEKLLEIRGICPNLRICAVFIHEEEAASWCERDREKLFRLVSACDEEWILRPFFGSEMLFQRNILMMNEADLVFLLKEDEETEFWASKMRKPVLKIAGNPRRLIPDIHLYRDGKTSIRC